MAEIDITRGLKAGRALAQSVSSPYEEERKTQRELQLYGQKKAIDAQYEQQNPLLQAMMSGQGGSVGGFRPTKFTMGGVTYENPEAEAAQKLQFEGRKGLDEYISQADKALVALDKVENYASKLGDFKTGFWNQAGARSKYAIDKFSQDPNVAGYAGVVSQELIPLARNLAEEKGPITDPDVARIELGLGNATAPLATKKLLLNELRNKVREALRIKSQVANITPEMFASNYPDLNQRAFGNPLQQAAYNQGNQQPSYGNVQNTDRQQIQQAIASGEYSREVIESMKRDFQSEYGEVF